SGYLLVATMAIRAKPMAWVWWKRLGKMEEVFRKHLHKVSILALSQSRFPNTQEVIMSLTPIARKIRLQNLSSEWKTEEPTSTKKTRSYSVPFRSKGCRMERFC